MVMNAPNDASETSVAPTPTAAVSDSETTDKSPLSSVTTETTGEYGDHSVRSMIEEAFDRSKSSVDQSGTTGGQAADYIGNKDPDGSDSTRSDPETTDDGGGAYGKASDSTPVSDDSPSTETKPTLPDNWPEERKGDFSKLPEQGQRLLLDIYKDMDSGLQQKFQQLATERKRIQDNFGLEPQQIHDLAAKARQYQEDPVALITSLADQAGVKVYFNQPEQPMPEFESQEEMAKWLLERSNEKATQAVADQFRKDNAQREKAAKSDQLKQEFLQAAQTYPDFADHREPIIQLLSTSNVTVDQAYRLATWDNLMKMAKEGNSQNKELEKTRNELETLKKQITMPVSASIDRFAGNASGNGLDMYERAMINAKRNIQSQP